MCDSCHITKRSGYVISNNNETKVYTVHSVKFLLVHKNNSKSQIPLSKFGRYDAMNKQAKVL